ncbi:MAG TPA: hypothetical protein VGO47_14410 [Chlamydiales bacterium]|nr:hypothetical protein [Chlamydiales bacterium]
MFDIVKLERALDGIADAPPFPFVEKAAIIVRRIIGSQTVCQSKLNRLLYHTWCLDIAPKYPVAHYFSTNQS